MKNYIRSSHDYRSGGAYVYSGEIDDDFLEYRLEDLANEIYNYGYDLDFNNGLIYAVPRPDKLYGEYAPQIRATYHKNVHEQIIEFSADITFKPYHINTADDLDIAYNLNHDLVNAMKVCEAIDRTVIELYIEKVGPDSDY